MGKKKKDKSVKLSLPKAAELYGVKIIKLPVGRYLEALTSIERLPSAIVDKLIPEAKGNGGLLEEFISADKKTIGNAITVLIAEVPQELCRFISRLLDIPEKRLFDPECPNGLTLNELIEIITAFWEMNDMSGFFGNVRRFMELTALTGITANTGCKDGLQ